MLTCVNGYILSKYYSVTFMELQFSLAVRLWRTTESPGLKKENHRWVGGQGLFKIFLINLFLTLGGGKSLFDNADPTYF